MVAQTRCPTVGKPSAMIESTDEQLVVEPIAPPAVEDEPSAPGLGMPVRRLLPVQRLFQGRRGTSTEGGRKATHNPLELLAENSGKSGSRLGFWHGDSAFYAKLWHNVLNIEIFDRPSRTVISSDGVVSEVSVLRPRALQAKGD